MHSEILKLFYENFGSEIFDMKNTNHNYNNENLNNYHVEGDVWTHTMMVYSEAIKAKASKHVLFAALLHDIGKPHVCESLHDKKRVRFIGHEGLSFYLAASVLNHKCYADIIDENDKHLILKLIALHSELFCWKHSEGNSDTRFANDQAFLNELAVLVECDYRGRLSLDPAHPNQTWKYISINCVKDKENNGKPELTLLIGPPASGKSTYCDKETIISRDDIVMELGGETTYSECWESVDQTKVDNELMKRFQKAVNENDDITIDMTNMSKKSRKKFLNNTTVKKHYWAKAVVLNCGYYEIMRRSSEREDKNISEEIIHSMMKRLSFPMYDEFDEIEIV